MAAVFDLNGHASYVHWHFFSMSVSNVLVIACMFAVFFAAIFIPFPKPGPSRSPDDGVQPGPSPGAPA